MSHRDAAGCRVAGVVLEVEQARQGLKQGRLQVGSRTRTGDSMARR